MPKRTLTPKIELKQMREIINLDKYENWQPYKLKRDEAI